MYHCIVTKNCSEHEARWNSFNSALFLTMSDTSQPNPNTEEPSSIETAVDSFNATMINAFGWFTQKAEELSTSAKQTAAETEKNVGEGVKAYEAAQTQQSQQSQDTQANPVCLPSL